MIGGRNGGLICGLSWLLIDFAQLGSINVGHIEFISTKKSIYNNIFIYHFNKNI